MSYSVLNLFDYESLNKIIRYKIALYWDKTMKDRFRNYARYKVLEAMFHAQPAFYKRSDLKTIFEFKIEKTTFINSDITPNNETL